MHDFSLISVHVCDSSLIYYLGTCVQGALHTYPGLLHTFWLGWQVKISFELSMANILSKPHILSLRTNQTFHRFVVFHFCKQIKVLPDQPKCGTHPPPTSPPNSPSLGTSGPWLRLQHINNHTFSFEICWLTEVWSLSRIEWCALSEVHWVRACTRSILVILWRRSILVRKNENSSPFSWLICTEYQGLVKHCSWSILMRSFWRSSTLIAKDQMI